MIFYVVRRVSYLGIIVIAMSAITFLLAHNLPGDPAVLRAGGVDATPETIAHARKELGVDRPLLVQYWMFTRNLMTADFGRSLVTRQPISQALKAFFPATVELGIAAILISSIVGIPTGIIAALYKDRWADRLIKPASIFVASMPLYWVGLVAVLIFYRILGLLPAGGRLDAASTAPPFVTGLFTIDSVLAGDFRLLWEAVLHLILPATVLSALPLGVILNVTRVSFLEVMKELYISTARAKGLSETRVVAKHALKNAAVPIVTVIGLQLGQLLGGVVLTETIFSWPGIGLYMVQAIETVDYPIIVTCTLVYSLAYGMLNFIVDLVYLSLNPQLST